MHICVIGWERVNDCFVALSAEYSQGLIKPIQPQGATHQREASPAARSTSQQKSTSSASKTSKYPSTALLSYICECVSVCVCVCVCVRACVMCVMYVVHGSEHAVFVIVDHSEEMLCLLSIQAPRLDIGFLPLN